MKYKVPTATNTDHSGLRPRVGDVARQVWEVEGNGDHWPKLDAGWLLVVEGMGM